MEPWDELVHCSNASGLTTFTLVPPTVAWHVPAYFNYGNGPAPQVHVAHLREWHQHYGAEVVTSAGDTVEMSVSHPPVLAEKLICAHSPVVSR